MDSIRIERACIYGFEGLNSLDNVTEHDVKVNLTLALTSQAADIKDPQWGSAKGTKNDTNVPVAANSNRLTTKHVNGTADNDDCNNNSVTFRPNMFSQGIIEDTVEIASDDDNECTQNDYLLANSNENNLRNECAEQGTYSLGKVDESGKSETTILLDISDNLTKIAAFSDVGPKDMEKIENLNYNEHESEFHESVAGLQTNCYENNGRNCFSTEMHMISENQDLFSEHDAIGKEYFMNHSCHHTAPGSGPHTVQSSTSCATSLKYENTQLQTNMSDEFNSDQYENIEFSTIFSSVDIDQRSFYQNYITENTSLLQDNSESSPNFITDLDGHSCEKSMTDNGVFGLSLTDTRSIEFLQSDEMQYSHQVPSSDQFCVDTQAEQNNSILYKLDDLHSTPAASNMITNSAFSDPNEKLVNRLTASHREYNSGWHITPAVPTVNQNAAALSLHYSQLNKSPSESSVYDPCLSDCNKNYQKCLYQSPQGYSTTSTEWSPWIKGSGTAYDIHTPFICSKQIINDGCSVSSTDTRGNLAKPEFVQFLQMEVKEDEEETDDADEIEYIPISFNTKNDNLSQNMEAESVVATVYQDENSSVVHGPLVLTPPPSASSTPVPSCSQDSCLSDDVDIFTHWPTSHYDNTQKYSSSARACKLKSEQLETSLLSFGLNQGTKRPFPSMADVMRNSRSKMASQKKRVLEAIGQQPRRSGRPRKTQIQSDKISTTAMNNKHRKKTSFKSKCETVVHDGLDVVNSPEVQIENGNNRTLGAARHNEPLNQQAIEIMTQWFENHIDNPYPSKADKEKMATQGDITENQVKSWFANKRNRTNNTKPKVQKRAMEEKLKEIFRDLKRNNQNPMADNSHVIQQLSGIIQHCHSTKQD